MRRTGKRRPAPTRKPVLIERGRYGNHRAARRGRGGPCGAGAAGHARVPSLSGAQVGGVHAGERGRGLRRLAGRARPVPGGEARDRPVGRCRPLGRPPGGRCRAGCAGGWRAGPPGRARGLPRAAACRERGARAALAPAVEPGRRPARRGRASRWLEYGPLPRSRRTRPRARLPRHREALPPAAGGGAGRRAPLPRPGGGCPSFRAPLVLPGLRPHRDWPPSRLLHRVHEARLRVRGRGGARGTRRCVCCAEAGRPRSGERRFRGRRFCRAATGIDFASDGLRGRRARPRPPPSLRVPASSSPRNPRARPAPRAAGRGG